MPTNLIPAKLASANTPRLDIDHEGGGLSAVLSGPWTADQAAAIEGCLSSLLRGAKSGASVTLDLGPVERLDTIGAWIIDRTLRDLRRARCKVSVVGAKPAYETLLREVEAHGFHSTPRKSNHDGAETLVDIGKSVSDVGVGIIGGLSFLGEVVAAALRLLRQPRHFRLPAFVHQMELIALRGLPIIALISFVVGGIIAQQGIFQLRRFDASDFVVDLVGILTLRELGVLLTSIMIAGRSGSSFTAELGAMKMREEIDALRVMGFDPMDVLILPRLIALAIGLPMLAFLADMSALFGGGLVAWLYQGISPQAFLFKLQTAISMHTFLSGLIKAPFMALIIGVIASLEGMAVKGSTEDLGRHVTASVVKAIFAVVVADGLFAMFFTTIDY
jgi:phospholipid/cholesterol/gamma-HCH transport system permease protein